MLKILKMPADEQHLTLRIDEDPVLGDIIEQCPGIHKLTFGYSFLN